MTQIEAVVEARRDGVTDDVGRESLVLAGIHELILPISAGLFDNTALRATLIWSEAI